MSDREEHAARLAEALRRNLHRRKAQARDRSDARPAPPDPSGGPDDLPDDQSGAV